MNLDEVVKLQAFSVTGTWEHRIKHDNKSICQEIAQEIDKPGKIDLIFPLLEITPIPKPYESAVLSIMIEPIKNFQMFFILADRIDTNFFFYFNPSSTSLIHGEDVIGWVEAYIRLIGRAFRNIDSRVIEMNNDFIYSSRLPETKLNRSIALTKTALTTICMKYNYLLEFDGIGQWQVTINQCPGIIFRIKSHNKSISYGYKTTRTLACEERCELITMALLHLNHILRETKQIE